jgi:hypothetical protein
MDEAAQLISAAAGRAITYRDAGREEWIAAMVSTGIPAEYAQVLRALTAIVASGVNRLKMLKRQTYGRAGFRLLRQRVLLTT